MANLGDSEGCKKHGASPERDARIYDHAQTLPGRRLQTCDEVTTALDLEAGRAPIEAAYAREASRGSPINYGFSASWAAARMQAVGGITPDARMAGIMGNIGDPAWQRAASEGEIAAIIDRLSADLAAGALGVGLLMGYAPGVDPDEYLTVARLAAHAGVPTFTHSRDLVELAPQTAVDGATEIVRAAGETGAHMHHCHLNSTSTRHVDRVLTTEAYPYGSGATAIGAAFLSPERLAERGLEPASLTYLPTLERVAGMDRLRELRATDPGGAVIVRFLDEDDPADWDLLRRSLAFDDAIVASDAMPPTWTTGRPDVDQWPLPPAAVTHPRTAGCFARALRLWREDCTPLVEAVRRCTLLPARVLERCAPAMKGKGRISLGADADLVVFDPELITDQATYADSTRVSTGIEHVLVAGTFVVREGTLLTEARPGRPVVGVPA